jgi:hypothetical protein
MKSLSLFLIVFQFGCGVSSIKQSSENNQQANEDSGIFFHEDFSNHELGDPLVSWGPDVIVLQGKDSRKSISSQIAGSHVVTQTVIFPENFTFEFDFTIGKKMKTVLSLIDNKGDELNIPLRSEANWPQVYASLPGVKEANIHTKKPNSLKLIKNLKTYKLYINGSYLLTGTYEDFSSFVRFRISVDRDLFLANFIGRKLPDTFPMSSVVEKSAINPIEELSNDIDGNIPRGILNNPDAVAVVIGISKYQNKDIPPVDYAQKDASLMKSYFNNLFGVDQKRIMEIYDNEATLSAFKRIFEEQLANYIRPGKSDVFIYYNGHGVPDPESQQTYFVPYDCNPAYAKSTGYRVQELYDRIAKLNAKRVTVVIDACFSGSSDKGMLLKGISPAMLRLANPIMAIENATLFTSSTDQQVSVWYEEKKHGLFTYYFLRGLRGEADENKDKQITVGELEKYVLSTVPDQARYLRNREQTPQVSGRDKQRVLVKY